MSRHSVCKPLLNSLALLAVLTWLLPLRSLAAEPARVLPEGKTPGDARLEPLKDLNGYFPFAVPRTKQEWNRRSDEVRRRILVANGLWPMPEPAPVKAVVHGAVERDGYTVEKVYLESYPGHYVTGSLYRPTGKSGRLPAVLSPHGHWGGGRFHDHGEATVKREMESGGEKFLVGGRHPLQARCVQLARMGCIVFHYDMLGYADSKQISFEVAHRFAKQRPEMESAERWGFFSAQAELRMQSVMGLQTYNSIRALDWLSQLPDVDPQRIGVTGASGGGTQTFILCAIDPRPAAAFPAVMVSTAMQGGCTCENASCLRIGTGNIEFAGLFAPRPLALSAANDWTKEMETKGMPELKQLYAMLGVPDRVSLAARLEYGHNFNYPSRQAMYAWFNEHLQLGHSGPIAEQDYVPLSAAEMSVWNDEHPQPPGGDEHEIALTRTLAELSDRQMAALEPKDAASLDKFREVVGGAFDTLIGRGLPPAAALEVEKVDKQDRGDYFIFKDLVRNKPQGEELPVLYLHPKKWHGQVMFWFDGRGKQVLLKPDGAPAPEVAALLSQGVSVASADLLYQGEFGRLEQGRVVGNPREFAGYTLGYNHPLFAQRVHDILTLVSLVRHDEHGAKQVYLLGTGGAGPLVAAARAQAGAAVDRALVDTRGFRFQNLTSYRDLDFLPGAVKYGDLPALLALSAPHELAIAGEAELPAMVSAAYRSAGKPKGVVTVNDALSDGLKWLTREN